MVENTAQSPEITLSARCHARGHSVSCRGPLLRRLRKLASWCALVTAGLLQACGGGGHGGGGGGGGGGSTSVTYSAQLTGITLEDTRRGQAVTATGGPVPGATITRN